MAKTSFSPPTYTSGQKSVLVSVHRAIAGGPARAVPDVKPSYGRELLCSMLFQKLAGMLSVSPSYMGAVQLSSARPRHSFQGVRKPQEV